MQFQSAVIDWLLSDENQPVRLLTLVNLLNCPPNSEEVKGTRARLMDYGPTQQILSNANEFLGNPDQAYGKYRGLYWQLIFLGWFMADGKDERISKGVNQILEHKTWVFKRGGQCLTANILASLIRLGYAEHPVVQAEIEDLAERIIQAQGIDCEAVGESLLVKCYMAQPEILLCFSEVPQAKRSKAVNRAIEILASRLIENQIFLYVPGNRKPWQEILSKKPKRGDLPAGQTVKAWVEDERERFLSSHGPGKPDLKPGWTKFGFPLNYNSDVLEAMYTLAVLRFPMSKELEKALALIKKKRTEDGKWILQNSLNGKMWADIETKGRPSRWLTYFALFVLKHFCAEESQQASPAH